MISGNWVDTQSLKAFRQRVCRAHSRRRCQGHVHPEDHGYASATTIETSSKTNVADFRQILEPMDGRSTRTIPRTGDHQGPCPRYSRRHRLGCHCRTLCWRPHNHAGNGPAGHLAAVEARREGPPGGKSGEWAVGGAGSKFKSYRFPYRRYPYARNIAN